jgi:YD repeat-containing protein
MSHSLLRATILPAAHYQYVAEAGLKFTPSTWKDWCAGTAISTADFDGDGKEDLWCSTKAGDIWVGRSLGNGKYASSLAAKNFCPERGTDLTSVGTADMNRDGRDDLFCHQAQSGEVTTLKWSAKLGHFGPVETKAFLTNGLPTRFCEHVPSRLPPLTVTRAADLNGDGRVDLFCSVHGSIVSAIARADGRFDTDTRAGLALRPSVVGDVDGDGRADVISSVPKIQVSFGDGNGAFSKPVISKVSCDAYIHMGDVNGDGKADVICRETHRTRVFISLGNGQFSALATPSTEWCGGDDRLGIADINGDGRTDLYCHSKNNGTLWTASIDVNGKLDPVDHGAQCKGGDILPSDLDGDGVLDFVCHEDGTGLVKTLTALGGAPLMNVAKNGMGGVTSITYGTSSDNAHNIYLPYVLPVVASVTVNDGRSPASTTRYTYNGGAYDRVGRRFLGFAYAKSALPCLVEDGGLCPFDETWFLQDPGSLSKPVRTERRRGKSGTKGELLTASTFAYAPKAGTAAAAVIPYRSNLTERKEYVFDAAGGTVFDQHKTCSAGHCKAIRTAMAYDNYGNVTQTNRYGDVTVSTDDSLTLTSYGYNSTAFLVSFPLSTTQYQGTTVVASRMLTRTLYAYDQKTFTPGAATKAPTHGNLNFVGRWLNVNNTYPLEQYVYDSFGNATSTTDAAGHTTTNEYSATYGSVLPTTSKNAKKQFTTIAYDPMCQLPSVQVAIDGGTTTTKYDAFCRMTHRATPLEGYVSKTYCAPHSTANTCGDIAGGNAQHIRTETPSAERAVPGKPKPTPQWTEEFFDGAGRVYRTRSKGADGTAITQTTDYNARGGTSAISAPYVGAKVELTRFEYDAQDRVQSKINPDGATRTIGHSLWTTTTKEGNLTRTESTDALGNPVHTQLGARRTTSVYDALGRRTAVVDAKGARWSYRYDSLGNLTFEDDPDAGATTRTYFPDGSVETVTDAMDAKTAYVYDALGRIKSEITTPKAGLPIKVTRAYDELSKVNVGHLTTMLEAVGTTITGKTVQGYKSQGLLTRAFRTMYGKSYTFAYDYDASGRLLWMRYPDGDTLGTAKAPIEYDGAGRQMTIPGVVTKATYTATGAPDVVTFANHVVTNYGYDAQQRVNSLVTTGDSTLQNLSAARYPNGKVKTVASSVAGQSWSYTYDTSGRLERAVDTKGGVDNQSFEFDGADNLTKNVLPSLGTYTYPIATRVPRP